jgi:hypothetical protein
MKVRATTLPDKKLRNDPVSGRMTIAATSAASQHEWPHS